MDIQDPTTELEIKDNAEIKLLRCAAGHIRKDRARNII
jgi:hypothetical protein